MTREDRRDRPVARLGRRSFVAAAGAGGLAAAAGVAAPGEAAAQSVAWKQAGNNHHVLALQDDGDGAPGGKVTIDYFGHCALRVTSPKGLTLMFDPWRNDPSGAWGLWFPRSSRRRSSTSASPPTPTSTTTRSAGSRPP